MFFRLSEWARLPSAVIRVCACSLTALLLFAAPAFADDTFIRNTRILIEQAAPGIYRDFFTNTEPRLIDGPAPPLARYRPARGLETKGQVEFGHDLRRYKREYIVATVIIPKNERPTFDQYMTVLTALSLANEKAHYMQDKNKSLADFFTAHERGDLEGSCALYGLQQHVSDIVMLDMALKLDDHFLRQRSPYGRNAVSAALDRLSLLSVYQEFRVAAAARDRTAMDKLLNRLKAARAHVNMSGLPGCPPDGQADLSKAVIARAVEPAYPYLLPPVTFFGRIIKPAYNE